MILVTALIGCPAVWSEEAAAPSDNPISQGDSLKITVYREEDLSGVFKVGLDGYIDYPLLRKIKAEGMGLEEFRRFLQEGLEADYLVEPQVKVEREEEYVTTISVLGQVNKPGNYQVTGNMTLVRLLSDAGGLTRFAGVQVTITRSVKGSSERKVMTANVQAIMQGAEEDIKLTSGDIVYIPESVF